MSNAAIYSYPMSTGPLQVDDLGEGLTEIVEEDVVECPVPTSAGGVPYPVLTGYQYRVRILLDGFVSATPGTSGNSVERALQRVKNHLNRGGRIGVTLDRAKTWATATTSTPNQGDTSLVTPGSLFSAWESSGVVAANDEIVVEMPAPLYRREIVQASAYSSGTVTVGALAYAYEGYPVVRWRYFWPVLFRHPDDGETSTNIVSNERTIRYRLDMTLRYSPDLAATLVGAGGYDRLGLSGRGPINAPANTLRPSTAGFASSAGYTLDQLVVPTNRGDRALTRGGWR